MTIEELSTDAQWSATKAHAELWSIGTGTVWTCSDCGTVLDEPEAPCPACGFGAESEPWPN